MVSRVLHNMLGACVSKHPFHSLDFSSKNFAAQPRQLVVPAALIVHPGIGTLVRLFYHPRCQETFDRRVEGAWAESHLPFSQLLNVEHDRVTVKLIPPQGQHDVKIGMVERQVFVDHATHTTSM